MYDDRLCDESNHQISKKCLTPKEVLGKRGTKSNKLRYIWDGNIMYVLKLKGDLEQSRSHSALEVQKAEKKVKCLGLASSPFMCYHASEYFPHKDFHSTSKSRSIEPDQSSMALPTKNPLEYWNDGNWGPACGTERSGASANNVGIMGLKK